MISVLLYVIVATIIFIGSAGTLFFVLLHCQPILLYKLLTRYTLFKAGMDLKYQKAGDMTFCYAERGKGKSTKPSMLFLHGITSSKTIWIDMIKELPQDLHIILVDMPGHGDTTQKLKSDHSYVAQANKIHQFVESYGLNKSPFHIIGASMGGGVAGVYAALYPQDLAKLTLMCPAGIITPELSHLTKELKGGSKRLLIAETAADLKNLMQISMYNEPKASDWMYKMGVEVQKPYKEFFQNVLADIIQYRDELQKRLQDIQTPTQVIWGHQDKFVDVSGVDVLKSEMKTLERVDVLQECGHTISMDRPEKAAQVLNEFVINK
ncbi:monoacylglycerol lipase abhd6-A-like [Glandiceps talaboti]